MTITPLLGKMGYLVYKVVKKVGTTLSESAGATGHDALRERC